MNFFDGHYFSHYVSTPEHSGESHHVPIYYGIQYNHSGRFWLRVNHGERFECEGPWAFITNPGAFFEYGSFPGETRHHNFICSYGERVDRYISSGLLPIDNVHPLIRIGNPERFLETMLRIISLLRCTEPVVPARAVLLYEELLLLLHEMPASVPAVPAFQENYFRRLVEEVRRHPEKTWDFNCEAARRNLTTAHFRRLFRTVAGLPPQQFLIQCRLQFAAARLVDTSEPVGRIAEDAGFCNCFYFSRLFKARFRLSPLEYRREFAGRGRINEDCRV